jgi:hypothetical protein
MAAKTTKTATILLRLTPEDRTRLQRLADADFLEAATWARQAVLRAIQEAEASRGPVPRSDRPALAPRRAR